MRGRIDATELASRLGVAGGPLPRRHAAPARARRHAAAGRRDPRARADRRRAADRLPLPSADAGTDGALGVSPAPERVQLTDPLGYLEFLGLVAHARRRPDRLRRHPGGDDLPRRPCFTLRDNTERPVTCEIGTNVLLGLAPERILELPALIDGRAGVTHRAPDGWDGHAALRVVDVLDRFLTDARVPAAAAVAYSNLTHGADSLNIGIIGLGYVGLPLAVAFAEAGHAVQGVDVDSLEGRGARRRAIVHRGHLHRRCCSRSAARSRPRRATPT